MLLPNCLLSLLIFADRRSAWHMIQDSEDRTTQNYFIRNDSFFFCSQKFVISERIQKPWTKNGYRVHLHCNRGFFSKFVFFMPARNNLVSSHAVCAELTLLYACLQLQLHFRSNGRKSLFHPLLKGGKWKKIVVYVLINLTPIELQYTIFIQKPLFLHKTRLKTSLYASGHENSILRNKYGKLPISHE